MEHSMTQRSKTNPLFARSSVTAINIENEIENWKVLGGKKYNKIPFPFRDSHNSGNSPCAVFILAHKMCQVHVGGEITLSEMSLQSSVSLIRRHRAHIAHACIGLYVLLLNLKSSWWVLEWHTIIQVNTHLKRVTTWCNIHIINSHLIRQIITVESQLKVVFHSECPILSLCNMDVQ